VLKTPIAEVVARYELCEDLACHLVEQAQTLYYRAIPPRKACCWACTRAWREGSVVSPAEAGWVVQRLAELLEWRAPQLPLGGRRLSDPARASAQRAAQGALARLTLFPRRLADAARPGPPGRRSIGSDQIVPGCSPAGIGRIHAQPR
jgi:hypothetical protein